MSEYNCRYCKHKEEFKDGMIEGYKPDGEKPWVYVPREPATFGHLVVVSGKCYKDISDAGLVQDAKHLEEMLKVITELATKMKGLTLNGKENGKKCEKVYVVSECETLNLHLHFHLIPRFEGDKKGHMFLFEKELEEARWMLENDKKDAKIRDGCERIVTAEGILNSHKNLIWSNKWTRPNKKREGFVSEIKKKIEEILKKERIPLLS